MRIVVHKIGKPKSDAVSDLVAKYQKRLRPLSPVTIREYKDSTTIDKMKREAGELWISLDERGEEWTTLAFVDQIRKWNNDSSIRTVHFFIGGPYGLSDRVRSDSHLLLALSKFTMPSDLAWLSIIEQLYRVFTVIKGMDYHHA